MLCRLFSPLEKYETICYKTSVLLIVAITWNIYTVKSLREIQSKYVWLRLFYSDFNKSLLCVFDGSRARKSQRQSVIRNHFPWKYTYFQRITVLHTDCVLAVWSTNNSASLKMWILFMDPNIMVLWMMRTGIKTDRRNSCVIRNLVFTPTTQLEELVFSLWSK